MADSADFAIGRLPRPIAGFLGLKNKLSLQGLAGEVMSICGAGTTEAEVVISSHEKLASPTWFPEAA